MLRYSSPSPAAGCAHELADHVPHRSPLSPVETSGRRPLCAALPELPDPSLAWEDLPAEDRRALTELLVDKIIIAPHPHKIDKAGRRHYTIRAIPYQDPEMEAERLKAVQEARVKIVPRV
jgi:hypothetical protein